MHARVDKLSSVMQFCLQMLPKAKNMQGSSCLPVREPCCSSCSHRSRPRSAQPVSSHHRRIL